MADSNIRYLLFDIESVADGKLISKIVYPDENYSPEKAVEEYGKARFENCLLYTSPSPRDS